MDEMTKTRMYLTQKINSEQAERKALEEKYGQVWNTDELREEFTVHSFLAPFISVTRNSDGVKGSLTFQHAPRYYFGWEEDK